MTHDPLLIGIVAIVGLYLLLVALPAVLLAVMSR